MHEAMARDDEKERWGKTKEERRWSRCESLRAGELVEAVLEKVRWRAEAGRGEVEGRRGARGRVGGRRDEGAAMAAATEGGQRAGMHCGCWTRWCCSGES